MTVTVNVMFVETQQAETLFKYWQFVDHSLWIKLPVKKRKVYDKTSNTTLKRKTSKEKTILWVKKGSCYVVFE